MRTALTLLFLSTLAIGCSKKDNMAAPVTPDTTVAKSCPTGGEAQAEGVVCSGATFDGCCFPDAMSACAAAGCADTCVQAETMPVQVSCPADEGAPAEEGPMPEAAQPQ